MMLRLKKYMFLLCATVLLLVGFSLSASCTYVGDTFDDGDLTYEVVALYGGGAVKGEVVLCDADTSLKGDVEVPSFVNDYKVVAIGEYAFGFCRKLESVILPDTVVAIEPYAFTYCEKLEEITIGGNLTSSDKGAFLGCKNLKKG